MEKKKSIGLTMSLLLVIFYFSTSAFAELSEDFKKNLRKTDIKNISIMIPDYLEEQTKVARDDVKMFLDSTKTKSIIVLIDEKPLTDDLKGVVSNWYEFYEKSYFPGMNPLYMAWNKLATSQYGGKSAKVEKIDFEDFQGFVITGTPTYKDGKRYIRDFQLYDKKNSEKAITIRFTSQSDLNYFLTDEEAHYIISTIKGLD